MRIVPPAESDKAPRSFPFKAPVPSLEIWMKLPSDGFERSTVSKVPDIGRLPSPEILCEARGKIESDTCTKLKKPTLHFQKMNSTQQRKLQRAKSREPSQTEFWKEVRSRRHSTKQECLHNSKCLHNSSENARSPHKCQALRVD